MLVEMLWLGLTMLAGEIRLCLYAVCHWATATALSDKWLTLDSLNLVLRGTSFYF